MIKVIWEDSYSSTMEDDEFGRWARIAHAGDKKIWNKKEELCFWQIASIGKLIFEDKIKFTINCVFPYSGKYVFDTLENAKKTIEKNFSYFIETCYKNKL